MATMLAADMITTGIAEDRILDRDYRTDGWDNAPVSVMDDDNVMLPTIIVTHGEGNKDLGSPPGANSVNMVVWAFSSRSDNGYEDVANLMACAYRVFDGKPVSGMRNSMHYAFEVGPMAADDGSLGQIWFRVSGIEPSEEPR